MKIGILTFHCAHNYGAVLQAYALQEKLRELGNEVEIIDYRQPVIIKNYSWFSVKRCIRKRPVTMIKAIINELLMMQKRYKRKLLFDNFSREWLSLSKSKIYLNTDVPDDYDLYIHGSDQIWNHKLTKGYDEIYLGNYCIKNGKRISYAASLELELPTEEGRFYFSKYLNNFDSISVREEPLIELLSPFTNKEITDALDPTLLTNASFWDKFIKKPNEGKYLLVYEITTTEKTMLLAKQIAKLLELKIVVLSNTIGNVNVEEFVGYFKYASFVVSTSFHATSFSILFKKPFYTIASGTGRDVRYTSLFRALGIEERLLHNISLVEPTNIDYDKVYVRLEKLQKKSMKYLSQFL